MNDFRPFLSVIVPVFNVEKRLNLCIDSILKQSYDHFELLLINDGSGDASGNICDSYLGVDKRIRVFHKNNGGASSARNLGIEESTGEYICFVDSDDYVDEHYLSSFLVEELVLDKNTLVIQSLINEIHGVVINQKNTFIPGLYTKKNLYKLFSVNDISRRGYPVCKLFSSEIIKKNNIQFNSKIHYCEDLLFMIVYLQYVKNVCIIDESHYYYISTTGTLSKSYYSYEMEFFTFQTLNATFKDLIPILKLNDQAIESFDTNTLGNLLFRSMISLYRPNNRKSRKERIIIIRSLHTKENLYYLQKYIWNLSKINKLAYWIFKYELFVLLDLYYSILFYLRYSLDSMWDMILKLYYKNKYTK